MKAMSSTDSQERARYVAPALSAFSLPLHLAFAVLIVASGVRYFMRHSASDNLPVLVLGIAVAALYTLIAVFSQNRQASPLWLILLMLTWTALVIMAPSFAWCSFSLFFLCRNAYQGRLAKICAGIVTAGTAVGLFRLSGFNDIAMLLGPLAAGALLTVVYDRIANDADIQRRLHLELALAQAKLFSREREAGAETERQRVSREIHDTFTQELASSILHLEAASRSWPSPGAQQQIIEATGLVRKSLSDSRGLVHELAGPMPPSLSLEQSISEATAAHTPAAQFIVTGTALPVSAEIQHALARITQSACANVALHAQATRVAVTLGYLPDAVTLDIYDDGVGFDPHTVPEPSGSGGYGLRAMRQRVEQLGGSFSIESTPGSGTFVAAQIPLPLQENL